MLLENEQFNRRRPKWTGVANDNIEKECCNCHAAIIPETHVDMATRFIADENGRAGGC